MKLPYLIATVTGSVILWIGVVILTQSTGWALAQRSFSEWIDLRDNWPREYAQACEMEAELRLSDDQLYFHRSCVPLTQVDFSQPEDLFNRACDSGACFI